MGDKALEICLGSACRDAGSDFLLDELRKMPGLKVESTFCQGRCAIGPNVRVREGEAEPQLLSGQGPDQAKALFERTKKSTPTPEKPFN